MGRENIVKVAEVVGLNRFELNAIIKYEKGLDLRSELTLNQKQKLKDKYFPKKKKEE